MQYFHPFSFILNPINIFWSMTKDDHVTCRWHKLSSLPSSPVAPRDYKWCSSCNTPLAIIPAASSPRGHYDTIHHSSRFIIKLCPRRRHPAWNVLNSTHLLLHVCSAYRPSSSARNSSVKSVSSPHGILASTWISSCDSDRWAKRLRPTERRLTCD